MGRVKNFEAAYFTRDRVTALKGNKKIYAVFSTYGEREAELIRQKIGLLKSDASGVVDKCILSHRREGNKIESTERNAKESWEDVEVIVCNDLSVPDMGKEKGKGADMRRCLYYINSVLRGAVAEEDFIVIFLDADVHTRYFGTHFIYGLAGAVLSGYDFAKASFWREMGRVKKYVAQPLFSVIDHPMLKGLSELAYPLSGEVAGTIKFFNSVHFWQRYGIETGIDIDSCAGGYKIADVNLGLYDHEHHDDLSIQKMSFGIIRTFMKQLLDYGIIDLKNGAIISDEFNATYIDEKGERQSIGADLSEKKYNPLCDVLGLK